VSGTSKVRSILQNTIPQTQTIPYSTDHPPATEHLLKRPAVEHLLQSAFKKPLTTVIAGAGYGKTQAVLSALDAMDCNTAWIQLSELDNHVVRFWERLSTAFEPYSHSLCDSLVSLGYPETIVLFDQFLRLLASELNNSFVLVLDDFHLINNRSILNFIELFISAHVQDFHIVLISRKKPDIGLSGMLSKGLLARVSEDDLRFSKAETNDYFHMQGIELSESLIADIYAYTDGWIFAIYLVGLAAQKCDRHNANLVLAAKTDIFNLVDKEVFAAASKALQDFLVSISVLDSIPSGLLRELAGYNLSLISEMMHLSMFIRYDPFSDSYSIHHLFRAFLQEKSGQLVDSDAYETHLSAAKWYANNNYVFEAIHHYEVIGCYQEMLDSIISIPGRVSNEDANALIELIERAPEALVSSMPIIQVVKAGYLFDNNRLDEAKRELTSLREKLETQTKTEENQAVLGEVYLLLALISMVFSDYEFVELFRMADERLPSGSKLVNYRLSIAEGLNACSIKDPTAGELLRYQDALFRAAPFAARAMNGCSYGLEYLNAAESSLYTGDWMTAEKQAYEAIFRSRQHLQYDIEYMANFVLVRLYTAKGNYEQASEILSRMKEQLDSIQHTECFYLYDIISGWFYTKLGKTDQVARWIKYEEETRKMLAPVIIGREYLVRSDCLLAEERYDELLAFMEQTDKVYTARSILFAVIQNKITKAIVHHYMGNHVESLTALHEAYELSQPNDLIMQYIEYGNRMRTLIRSAKKHQDCTIPREWLDRVYTKSSSYAKMLAQLVSKYTIGHEAEVSDRVSLSKREAEVLVHLYRGMTRKEIAANSYLSLSTVNSILKNIYSKLGAANAADAIRLAKEMNLL
jgi:LuxR family maltose regulon positive regulatory protein